MLLDVRTYTCRPGTIKKHLALYEKLGKGPQTKHLGQPFAYLVTETGMSTSTFTSGPTKMRRTVRSGAPQ